MFTRTSVLAAALGVALLATVGTVQAGDKTADAGTATRADGEQVKTVQQALKDKGHDPGPIDGVMGPRTLGALREFQTKEGLTATGRLDDDTMSKLGIAAADASNSPSASPPTIGASPSDSPGPSGAAGTSPGATSGESTESKTDLPPRAPDSGAFQNK